MKGKMSANQTLSRPTTLPPAAARRAGLVSGWTLIVLGIVHLATVAFDAAQPSEATRVAFEAMRQSRVLLPGPQPTMVQLFYGFSLTMALGLMAFGTLVVLVARRRAGTTTVGPGAGGGSGVLRNRPDAGDHILPPAPAGGDGGGAGGRPVRPGRVQQAPYPLTLLGRPGFGDVSPWTMHR